MSRLGPDKMDYTRPLLTPEQRRLRVQKMVETLADADQITLKARRERSKKISELLRGHLQHARERMMTTPEDDSPQWRKHRAWRHRARVDEKWHEDYLRAIRFELGRRQADAITWKQLVAAGRQIATQEDTGD